MQDGSVEGEFKMLTPEELVSNDTEQLRQLVQERRSGKRRHTGRGVRDNKELKVQGTG
jgi:hypothetical protein